MVRERWKQGVIYYERLRSSPRLAVALGALGLVTLMCCGTVYNGMLGDNISRAQSQQTVEAVSTQVKLLCEVQIAELQNTIAALEQENRGLVIRNLDLEEEEVVEVTRVVTDVVVVSDCLPTDMATQPLPTFTDTETTTPTRTATPTYTRTATRTLNPTFTTTSTQPVATEVLATDTLIPPTATPVPVFTATEVFPTDIATQPPPPTSIPASPTVDLPPTDIATQPAPAGVSFYHDIQWVLT